MKGGKKICPGSRLNATKKTIGQENMKMHKIYKEKYRMCHIWLFIANEQYFDL